MVVFDTSLADNQSTLVGGGREGTGVDGATPVDGTSAQRDHRTLLLLEDVAGHHHLGVGTL